MGQNVFSSVEHQDSITNLKVLCIPVLMPSQWEAYIYMDLVGRWRRLQTISETARNFKLQHTVNSHQSMPFGHIVLSEIKF